MLQIVTLPEWERPMPHEYCQRSETYWSCVELPVRDGWVFIVNLQPDTENRVAMRSIVVVSAIELLSVIARRGRDSIRSIHLISQIVDGDEDDLNLDRLVAIDVGSDPDVRWTKVIQLKMSSGRSICSPSGDAVRRMINRVEMNLNDRQPNPQEDGGLSE